MILNTIAEGMSLARKLDTESGSFYEALAKKYPKGAETCWVKIPSADIIWRCLSSGVSCWFLFWHFPKA
jgi:hypothetical protein